MRFDTMRENNPEYTDYQVSRSHAWMHGQQTMAVIDLYQYGTFEKYFESIKKVSDSHPSAYRKANRLGFTAHQFVHANFVPDIVEINFSKPVRCGREMAPSYRRTVEDFGGFPRGRKQPTPVTTPYNNSYLWGCFSPCEDYTQGDIIMNEKLVAYISYVVIGELGVFSMILGHGDYLRFGVVPFLALKIIKWTYRWLPKTQYVMYGQWGSGGERLDQWKRHMLFSPTKITVVENG